MNVCGVTFGGYLAKILSFKTGNLLNNSKFHLLSEGTVQDRNKIMKQMSIKKCFEDKFEFSATHKKNTHVRLGKIFAQ